MMDKMNNLTSVAGKNAQSSEARAPSKRQKGPNEPEFSGELAFAGMSQVALPQQQANLGQAASGLKDSLTQSADRSPLTLKTAASVNTANALAGLKPWSRDWIFDGQQIEQAQGQNEQKTLEAMLSDLSKSAAEVAAQNSKNGPVESRLRETRGDAGATGSPETLQKQLLMGDVAAAGNVLAPDSVILDELPDGVSRSQGPRGVGELSGGEFLTALDAVRGGKSALSGENPDDSKGGQEGGLKGAPSLRLVEGGLKGKKNPIENELTFSRALSPAGMDGIVSKSALPLKAAELNAHVVQGAMAQDRLSTDALMGLSLGIRNLSPQGGGEIRLRLKPDNLGELQVRVMTRGNQVGLEIQASDQQAKRIIEDSMSYLKESLAAHHLSLGSVDLSVAQHSRGASGGDTNQQQGSDQAHSRDMMGQNANQGNQRQWNSWSGVEGDSTPASGGMRAQAAARNAVASGTGSREHVMSTRLDVKA